MRSEGGVSLTLGPPHPSSTVSLTPSGAAANSMFHRSFGSYGLLPRPGQIPAPAHFLFSAPSSFHFKGNQEPLQISPALSLATRAESRQGDYLGWGVDGERNEPGLRGMELYHTHPGSEEGAGVAPLRWVCKGLWWPCMRPGPLCTPIPVWPEEAWVRSLSGRPFNNSVFLFNNREMFTIHC